MHKQKRYDLSCHGSLDTFALNIFFTIFQSKNKDEGLINFEKGHLGDSGMPKLV